MFDTSQLLLDYECRWEERLLEYQTPLCQFFTVTMETYLISSSRWR